MLFGANYNGRQDQSKRMELKNIVTKTNASKITNSSCTSKRR